MRIYTSCNCSWCRGVPSSVKRKYKREAHRKFRRESKRALRSEGEAPNSVSTGYKT